MEFKIKATMIHSNKICTLILTNTNIWVHILNQETFTELPTMLNLIIQADTEEYIVEFNKT